MKIGKGIGRVIGEAVRERIRKAAADARPPTRRRAPSHVDETVRDAAAEARRKGITPASRRAAAGRPGARDAIRALVGDRFHAVLQALSETEWRGILAYARRYRDPRKGLFSIKGYIAERLIPNLPQYAALKKQLAKTLRARVKTDPRFADLDPTVHFVRDVAALSPDGKGRWLQLTDGVLVAFSKEVDPGTGRPRRVVILAVLEAKSPKNYADLVEEGLGWRKLREARPELKARTREPDRKWLGQFGKDFERFAELPTRFGEWEFVPEEVLLSRHNNKNGTRWVSILPRDMSFAQEELGHLAAQGFAVDQWQLPITDRELTRAAEQVIKHVVTGGKP